MKKLVTLIAAAVLSAGTFAQTKLLNSVNISVPLTFYEGSYKLYGVDTDISYKDFSVDADFTGAYILKNNVMLTYGAQAGYTHEGTDLTGPDGDDVVFKGFNCGLRAGAGYAFINTEKMLLGASAFTGFSFLTADWDYDDGISQTITNKTVSIPLGVSVSGTNYFSGKKMGIFYGVDFSYNFTPYANWTLESGSYTEDIDYDVDSSITVTPKVGFAFSL